MGNLVVINFIRIFIQNRPPFDSSFDDVFSLSYELSTKIILYQH